MLKENKAKYAKIIGFSQVSGKVVKEAKHLIQKPLAKG